MSCTICHLELPRSAVFQDGRIQWKKDIRIYVKDKEILKAINRAKEKKKEKKNPTVFNSPSRMPPTNAHTANSGST